MLVRPQKINLPARFRHLDEVDWDFATSRSQSSFSSLHWHPCRYPSQVPSVIIGALSNIGETVLDPFLGSGTSAVEAQRLERNCIGLELNPVAALMARAKTIARSAKQIKKIIDRVSILARQSTKLGPVPPTVQADKWYTPRTLNDLRRLRSCIGDLRGDGRLLAEAAFSAILLSVCRETRHWGYVCDNTAPKDDYERDVMEIFERTLEGFGQAYTDRDGYWASGDRPVNEIAEVSVLEGDAASLLEKLPPASVQLIVTSPPYFGVADYVKAQRLSLEWRGLEIEPLRQKEIGARSKRRRHVAADEYLHDCKIVFERCRNVLEDGRACAVVFGESTDREPMEERFVEAVEAGGFKLKYKKVRKISVGRRFAPKLQEELLLIFV